MTEHIINYYDCDACGYRYDPKKFENIELDAQPDSFECPQCHAGRDHFQLWQPPSDDLAPQLDGSEEEHEWDPSGPRLMYVQESSPILHSLHGQWTRKRLDTQPDFQRYEVWSTQKKSALIESILLDLPIPQVFLAQEDDGRTVVIDGQQRLTAVFRYINDEYALAKVAPKLVGKRFSELSVELQEKIENYTLRVVTILKESDHDVRFMLFQRLNEGSVSLNDQELRNCVWRGPYNEMIKSLAAEPAWLRLLRLRKSHPRMVDVELTLRFMAFHDQSYMNHPDKKTGQFLDKQMSLGSKYSAADKKKAQRDFKDAIELAQTVFGDRACRRFVPGSEDAPGGKWDSKINRALMDVQLWGFNRYSKGVFVRNADAVREAAIELMSTEEFSDLISHTISEFKRVERRFDLWKQMLDSLLQDENQGPRLFSREQKEMMFEADPVCSLCGQAIQTIDDAHVDHALPHSKGGKTTKSNAKLAHRYCNLSKGNRPSIQSPSSLST